MQCGGLDGLVSREDTVSFLYNEHDLGIVAHSISY